MSITLSHNIAGVTIVRHNMPAKERQMCEFCPPEDQRKVDAGFQIDGKPACQPCAEVWRIGQEGFRDG